jgi:hypothetical protein
LLDGFVSEHQISRCRSLRSFEASRRDGVFQKLGLELGKAVENVDGRPQNPFFLFIPSFLKTFAFVAHNQYIEATPSQEA